MDARQRRSKSALTKLHKRAGSLPPSVRPEAFKQHHCSANYNVQQNQVQVQVQVELYCKKSC